jgi:branched-subunit amino acid transport protein AzlD
MKTTGEAVVYTFVIAAVIVFCRAFPFLFFRAKKEEASLKRMEREKAFISFVEKTVPPAAMTVLAFNSITMPFKENYREGLVVLTASILTALVHLLRRNTLLSIFGGTAAYFALEKLLMR